MKKMWNLFAALFVMAAVVMTSCSNPSDGGGSNSLSTIQDIVKASTTYDYYRDAKVGDFILTDGSICKQNSLTDNLKTKVVAVIFRPMIGANPALGIGIKFENGKAWVESGLSGNPENTSIEALKDDATNAFKDGSTGYTKYSAAISSASTDIAKHPAWAFCKNYGTTYNLKTLNSGWYLPTESELKTLMLSAAKVKESLSLAGAEDFGVNYYFTSNQDIEDAKKAVTVNLSTGAKASQLKTTPLSVCAVRAFSCSTIDYINATIGDIILKNGLLINPDDYSTGDALAVVAFGSGLSSKLAVSVVDLNNLAWCTSEAYAKNDKFNDLLKGTLKFGFNSYEKLAGKYGDIVTDINKYPAWKECRNYGINNGALLHKSGWFMAATNEYWTGLANNSENLTKINNSISRVGGDLIQGEYWTCNQAADADKAALYDLSSKTDVATSKTELKKVRPFIVLKNGDFTVQTVKKPTIKWGSDSKIKIECDTVGASIYYMIGNEVKAYNGEFDFVEGHIRAYAIKNNMNPSAVADFVYYRPVY